MKKKLLAALIASSFVIGCTSERPYEELVAEAEKYQKENNLSAAIIELKNAIQQSPELPQARLLLGSIHLNSGDPFSAAKEFERALASSSQDPKILSMYGKALFQMNDSEKLEELLNRQLPEQTQILVASYLSILSSQKGDAESAKNFLDQASMLTVDSNYIRLSKAWISGRSDIQTAVEVASDIINSGEPIDEAYILRGHLYSALNAFDKAVADYTTYLEKYPKFNQARLFRASALINNKSFDLAEKDANLLLSVSPNHPLLNQIKSQILFHRGEYRLAEEHADKALVNDFGSFTSSIISGFSAFQQQKLQKAYKTLRTIEEYTSKGHAVRKVLAVIRMELGYLDEASSDFNQLLHDESLDDASIEIVSSLLMKLGQEEQASNILEQALTRNPDNARIKTLAGTFKLFQRDKEATALLEEAILLSPESAQAQIALALSYLQNNQAEKALSIALDVQKLPEQNENGLILSGLALFKLGQIKESLRDFKEASEKHNSIAAKIHLASINEQEKDFSKSNEYFRQIIIQDASHPSALQGLIRLSTSSEDKFNNRKFLTELGNNNIQPALSAARIIYEQEGLDSTLSYLKKLTQHRGEPDYLLALGETYRAAGEVEQSINTFLDLTKSKPNEIMGWLKYISLLIDTQQNSQAISAADTALTSHQDSSQLIMLKAQALINKGQFNQARNLVNSLNGNTVFFHQLKAKLALSEQNFETAIYHLNVIYQYTNKNDVLSVLTKLLFDQSKGSEATELLEAHLEKHPDDFLIRLRAADHHSKMKNFYNSARHYEEALAKAPNNYIILNNLAWVYVNSEKIEKALELAEKAYQEKPNNINVIDTLAYINYKSGNISKAKDLYEKVSSYKEIPDEIMTHYKLVMDSQN